VLLASAILLTAGGLAVDGLVLGHGRDPSPDTRPPVAGAPPESVTTGGPVIDARGGTPRSSHLPDKTIALTFDDGPDPRWTPQILDVLRRHGVPATFFVTGAGAASHPLLLRSVVADGHEVGNHTTTHADLGTSSPGRAGWEVRQNQVVLAGAAGRQTALLRPPYSSTPDAVDGAGWRAIQRAAVLGYLVVLADLNTKDWQRPGVDAIVAGATPPDQHGAIVLLHDGGGDRAQTVAAVDRLIPKLRADGWRFATVSGALGAADTSSPAGTGQRVLGFASIAAAQFATLLGTVLPWLLIVATVLALLRAVIVLAAALLHRRTRRRRWRPPAARDGPPPVTVIVPAYNERACIAATVRSILASRHRPLYVIVVDDGSSDGTAEEVRRLRSPHVWLIRQDNQGKAAAMANGLSAARTELVVLVDGDTVVEPGSVTELVRPFADASVGAVSGNAKVGNRHGLLGRWQHIEYVMGFNLDRRMYDVLECMPTVPGAVGAFRRQAIADAGGVPGDTLAEDTDLTMALLRAHWRVVYATRARAWTEAPADLGQLWKQRYRWCYGTLQAMYKHRHAVVERAGGGRLGRRGLPYLLLFQVLLPMLAPVVDVAAVYTALFDPMLALVTWSAFLLLQLVPAVVAFRLDGERLGSLWSLPLQQFVYRQLMYLVVIQSVVTAVAGARLPWHKLTRAGQVAQPPPVRAR
jgi:cellulose synthase/poly-beta-1,6-N-acetylglucosamine synthase-like glycosyltransferase/peptidoglycan/xylan/chitin deacetylase (PgdA/CDA1 family)